MLQISDMFNKTVVKWLIIFIIVFEEKYCSIITSTQYKNIPPLAHCYVVTNFIAILYNKFTVSRKYIGYINP